MDVPVPRCSALSARTSSWPTSPPDPWTLTGQAVGYGLSALGLARGTHSAPSLLRLTTMFTTMNAALLSASGRGYRAASAASGSEPRGRSEEMSTIAALRGPPSTSERPAVSAGRPGTPRGHVVHAAARVWDARATRSVDVPGGAQGSHSSIVCSSASRSSGRHARRAVAASGPTCSSIGSREEAVSWSAITCSWTGSAALPLQRDTAGSDARHRRVPGSAMGADSWWESASPSADIAASRAMCGCSILLGTSRLDAEARLVGAAASADDVRAHYGGKQRVDWWFARLSIRA